MTRLKNHITHFSLKKKEYLSLNQLSKLLIYTGIFFIPFNSFSGLSFLGEYSKESATIFFFLAAIVTFIEVLLKKKFFFPYSNLVFSLLILFTLWLLLSTGLNLYNISSYYFKQTSGIERFVRQFISFFISAGIFLFTYLNTFYRTPLKTIFKRIRVVFLYGLIVVTLYSLLEILIVKFHINALENVLNWFNYFPFVNVYLDSNLFRISSVTYEPPALATYLITICGWMLSYMLTSTSKWRFLPMIIVLMLTYFSGSRAGLFIILLQYLIFFILLVYFRKWHHTIKTIFYSALFVGALAIVFNGDMIVDTIRTKATSFSLKDDDHSISNRSRFGIQTASLNVFWDHPVTGVGFGQQAFEGRKKYPRWSTLNNWEFRLKYLNESKKNFPPGYNIYTRLLAETGIVGFLIFLTFLSLIGYSLMCIYFKNNEDQVFSLILFIMIVGFIVNWFKADTFRVFGFWIAVALVILVLNKYKLLSNSGYDQHK